MRFLRKAILCTIYLSIFSKDFLNSYWIVYTNTQSKEKIGIARSSIMKNIFLLLANMPTKQHSLSNKVKSYLSCICFYITLLCFWDIFICQSRKILWNYCCPSTLLTDGSKFKIKQNIGSLYLPRSYKPTLGCLYKIYTWRFIRIS